VLRQQQWCKFQLARVYATARPCVHFSVATAVVYVYEHGHGDCDYGNGDLRSTSSHAAANATAHAAADTSPDTVANASPDTIPVALANSAAIARANSAAVATTYTATVSFPFSFPNSRGIVTVEDLHPVAAWRVLSFAITVSMVSYTQSSSKLVYRAAYNALHELWLVSVTFGFNVVLNNLRNDDGFFVDSVDGRFDSVAR
jgi:hypothetical protein